MPNQRWRSHLAASVLLVCALLVTLSLLSHDPTNASRDFLGTPGDWLAVSLYQSLGIAVYFLLAGWLVLVALLFRAKLAQMVLPGGGVAAVTAVQCRCGGLPGNAVARHVAARAWRQHRGLAARLR